MRERALLVRQHRASSAQGLKEQARVKGVRGDVGDAIPFEAEEGERSRELELVVYARDRIVAQAARADNMG